MMKLVDLVGESYGRLTVIDRAENSPPTFRRPSGSVRWLCRCECGNEIVVRPDNLKNGNNASCGCLRRESTVSRSTIHGFVHHDDYNRYVAQLNRCFNPKNTNYRHYGARGISMCSEWVNSFEAYVEYISKLSHYGESGYTLDRIDNDGNYEPGNVRWATPTEQVQNRRKRA